MYESITYAELKSLPREQKIEALKELKALYSSQKKIAEKLGVNPPNIYNMISRYIKDDNEEKPGKKGRTKKQAAGNRQKRYNAAGSRQLRSKVDNAEQILAESAANEQINDQIRDETTDNRQTGDESAGINQVMDNAGSTGQFRNEAVISDQAGSGVIGAEESNSCVIGDYSGRSEKGVEYYGRNDFLISIAKDLTGEEARSVLAGIGNIFLKDREYRLDIRITEK